MLRDFPNPFHAAVFHGDIGIQPTGDGVVNQNLAAFVQEGNQPFFLRDGGVDLGGFTVEKFDDAGLFV